MLSHSACRAHAPPEWLRERWHIEQSLLKSGIDATVLHPGYIVGVGGRGFDTITSNAKKRLAISLGGDFPKMRTIAIDDLVYYLAGSLNEPRTFGKSFHVGGDDVMSANELLDGTADILGR